MLDVKRVEVVVEEMRRDRDCAAVIACGVGIVCMVEDACPKVFFCGVTARKDEDVGVDEGRDECAD